MLYVYYDLARESGCIINFDIHCIMMCSLPVWGLYYEKMGDNVCTDAHIKFDVTSECFVLMTDSTWTYSKVKIKSKSIVFSPTITNLLLN